MPVSAPRPVSRRRRPWVAPDQGRHPRACCRVHSALGDSALVWSAILPALAADGSMACAYDRAGLGWSDPTGHGRYGLDRICAYLRGLLTAARIGLPVVLVGHSVGGVIARRFTARYPEAVAGLLLIDSSHEDQWGRMRVATGHRGDRAAVWRAVRHSLRPLGLYRAGAALGLARDLDACTDREVPRWYAASYRAASLSSRARRAIVRELLLFARLRGTPPRLGSLPVTVLTAGDLPDERRQTWMQMQEELAGLSSDSRHVIVASASHYIHLDEAEAVVRAMRELIVRADNPRQ